MKGAPLNTLPKESVDAIVRSTERIEGAASILAMLEEKADGGACDPVGDSRREMRARELRGGAGWCLGEALGHPRLCWKTAIRSSSSEPNRLPTWQKPQALDTGKILEALAYSAKVDPLVVLLGLDLADLRSEPFGPSCDGLPVLALERGGPRPHETVWRKDPMHKPNVFGRHLLHRPHEEGSVEGDERQDRFRPVI